jgi:diacylglycerol kinase (ATP)
VETAIDRIGENPHRLSGRAKDMGSAAVFISLWTAAITWGLIAWERFTS